MNISHNSARRRPLGVVLTLLVLVGLAFVANPATAEPDPKATTGKTNACAAVQRQLAAGPQARLDLAELPQELPVEQCGLVGEVVWYHGYGLTVPEPGFAAGTSGLSSTGGHSELFEIQVSEDGTLTHTATDEPEAEKIEPLSSPNQQAAEAPECSMPAYALNDLRANSTMVWLVGDGAMPGNLSIAAAQTAFARSIANITDSYTTCSAVAADLVSATARYGGQTITESSMTNAGACMARNDRPTWDGNPLPNDRVGQTCWHSTTASGPNPLVEADVRFNTNVKWGLTPAAPCDFYMIRGTGTHEAGHVFGLGHPAAGNQSLTMGTPVQRCDMTEESLGLGDVNGLRARY